MKLSESDFFLLDHQTRDRGEWHQAAFNQAFGDLEDSPFRRVTERLNLGHSVLVYLPGVCMGLAASYFSKRDRTEDESEESPTDWSEYGRFTGNDELSKTWSSSRGVVPRLLTWLRQTSGGWPRAIFHNLDLLMDTPEALHQDDATRTALAALQEATRMGTVLGLADRDAGTLPARLSRLFPEQIRLDEIAEDAFIHLIPWSLGKLLSEGREVDISLLRPIASRLRYLDPLRAIRLMDDVANEFRNATDPPGQLLPHLLKILWEKSRTLGYEMPAENLAKVNGSEGIEEETIDLINNRIVFPFKRLVQAEHECGDIYARLPPGIVLHGPPGTGKTFIARWIAYEIGIPIRVVTAAELRRSGYGETERLVHALFQEARRVAPCILLIDEADDLFLDRKYVSGSVAGAERAVVNAALQQLEGLEGRPTGVLVMMTSNRYSALDEAIRSKIGLACHIPYPLHKQQVRDLVAHFATEQKINITNIREKLVNRFYQTLNQKGEASVVEEDKPDNRRYTDQQLFSPRTISQAMQHLVPGDSEPADDGLIHIEEKDFERMSNYYKKTFDERFLDAANRDK